MAAHDAGVQVTCPGCGQTVLQKSMIPVLGENGHGVSYLCPACARALIVTTADLIAARSDRLLAAGTIDPTHRESHASRGSTRS